MSDALYLRLDASSVVIGVVSSHEPQPDDFVAEQGLVETTSDVYAAAAKAIGASKLVDGALQPYAPPTIAPYGVDRRQLGGTFLGAVADLGWWGWFDQGAAAQVQAGKPVDKRYWDSIGKADQVLATDAKLGRVARAAEAARVAASGQPAPAAPVITVAAAMDHGDAMVAAAAKPYP